MCDRCNSRFTIERREFLRLGGGTLFLLGAGSLLDAAGAAAGTTPGVLVVFFQRGAADGLHMVIPYRESNYRALRSALAFKEPGRGDDEPRDLGDGFSLNPALGALHPLYAAGRLAVVHAVGSPDATRSHFDAQDYMESGTPGSKGTRDGWLSRALSAATAHAGPPSPFSAVALSSTLPRALAGATDAIALPDFSKLGSSDKAASLGSRIEEMYRRDGSPEFVRAGEEAFRALKLFREKDPLSTPVRSGVRYPRGKVGTAFEQLAHLLKSDLGIRIAFLEGGGWDTHFNQGTLQGQMVGPMRELAGSVAAFFEDLGRDAPVTLMTMTEFGRSVATNGAGGTDHGHGTAMMVAGSGVRGGRVFGEWPGVSKGSLFEGRDLAVTTDFRDLFAEVATSALALPPGASLFPGHHRKKTLGVTS